MQKRILMRLALLIGVATALVGCSDGEEPTDTSAVATQTEALAAWDYSSTYPMWPRVNDSYSISVCFRQCTLSANATPNWSGDKSLVQTALTQTWETHSGIDFVFKGDCPASIPSAWMPIELEYDSSQPGSFGGEGFPGMGRRMSNYYGRECECGDCQVHLSYGSDYHEFQTVAVHEVGHSLGLRHETSRSDFPGCEIVLPGGGHVSRGLETGPLLTKDPDNCSIMGYWDCCWERMHDSTAWYSLSDGDKAGVGVLYPKLLTGRSWGAIGSTRGFATPNGVIIRGDGSVCTDRTAAGVHPSTFQTQPAWYARRSGSADVYLGTGLELSASSLASVQYSQVYFSYSDAWGRANNGADQVVVSSPRHTAILMSSMIRL